MSSVRDAPFSAPRRGSVRSSLSRVGCSAFAGLGDDGVAIKAEELAWLRDNVTQLEVIDLGPGKHFLQETHPHRIGAEIARWRAKL